MEGRGRILIAHSFCKRNLQKNTVEKILHHLRCISMKYGGSEADKRARDLMPIIEDERNTEADIIAILEKMEK